MYFRNLLKLFSKNKNASEEVHPEVAESVNLASSERGSQEQNGLPTQVNSTSERESKQVQHCTEEAGNPISLEEEHHHRTQALADKVYAESGASFYLITHDPQPASRADMASEGLPRLHAPIQPTCS